MVSTRSKDGTLGKSAPDESGRKVGSSAAVRRAKGLRIGIVLAENGSTDVDIEMCQMSNVKDRMSTECLVEIRKGWKKRICDKED